MAIHRGLFDETLVPEGWFDRTAKSEGWFDDDNLDVPAGGPVIETRSFVAAAGAATASTLTAEASLTAADGAATASTMTAQSTVTASMTAAAGVATSTAMVGEAVGGGDPPPEAATVRPLSFIPVRPMFMDVVEWADETMYTLYDVAAVPRLEAQGEREWVAWATSVVGHPSIAAFNPPDPDLYATDWREWAHQFNEALAGQQL